MDVWCVQHTKGWCAMSTHERPSDDMDTVKTLCRHVVILPLDIQFREPTCDECKKKLAK